MFAQSQRRTNALLWPLCLAMSLVTHGMDNTTCCLAQNGQAGSTQPNPNPTGMAAPLPQTVVRNSSTTPAREVDGRLREFAEMSAGRPGWNKSDRERVRWTTREPLPGHAVDLLQKLSGEVSYDELSQLCTWRIEANQVLVGIPQDAELRLFVRQIEIAPWVKEQGIPRIVIHTRTSAGPVQIAMTAPPNKSTPVPSGSGVVRAGGLVSAEAQELLPVRYVIETPSPARTKSSPEN